MAEEIHEITGISVQAFQGIPLSRFSVDERMLWATRRETKREEDAAYSLLGIFDIHMPLIYGEGREKALIRLQKKIAGSLRAEWPILSSVPVSAKNRHVGMANRRVDPLYHAARNGHVAVVDRLVPLNLDAKGKTHNSRTALHVAAEFGHVAMVDRLVELGMDLKEKSNDGWTALHLAAQNGHISTVNRMIELGVDPKEKLNDGMTALHAAAEFGHVAMVDWLVENGVDSKAKLNDGTTALYLAARNGHIAIVDRLVALNLDANF